MDALRGAPVEGAFPLSDVERHNRAQLRRGEPLWITTEPARWSYAASIRRRALGADEAALDPVIVTVRSRVLQGRIGFGLLGADGRTFLDERQVPAGPEIATVELVAGPLGDVAALMVRNAGTGGASSCSVLSVEAHRGRELVLGAELPAANRTTLSPDPAWSRFYGASHDRLEDALRARAFAKLDRSLPMPWLEGLRIVLHPTSEMCRAIFVSGVYEPNNAIVMRGVLRPGDVVADVGANLGAFTLLASRFVGPGGRVLAFEPSPRDFARLLENVEQNALPNVRALPVALGDTPGEAWLHVAADEHGGHNTLGEGFGAEGVVEAERCSVSVSTLDRELSREGVERLDFVKLDVEGGEIRCLHGAARTLDTLRPVLLFEVSPPSLARSGGSVAELEALVHRAGYSLFDIDPETAGLRPIASLAECRAENVVAAPAERRDRLTGLLLR